MTVDAWPTPMGFIAGWIPSNRHTCVVVGARSGAPSRLLVREGRAVDVQGLGGQGRPGDPSGDGPGASGEMSAKLRGLGETGECCRERGRVVRGDQQDRF